LRKTSAHGILEFPFDAKGHVMTTFTRLGLATLVLLLGVPAVAQSLAEKYAREVTIVRDQWGVPHIDGPTDASVVFGVAYASAEDYFWQVEETLIQNIGRYAEVVGESGLRNDQEVAAFRIVERSKADYETLRPDIKAFCDAYAAGYNYFLAKNSHVKPRLIDRYEPYYLLCYERAMMMARLLGHAKAPRGRLSGFEQEVAAATGSNAWAISGEKTASGNTMLFANPHQPWYGTGMFTEIHVHSREGEGWNFSGSTFPGGPFPTMGHNGRLGWAYTVNEPDVGDVYRVTFDHPEDPLLYRYDGDWRKAEQWTRVIRVKTETGVEDRTYTFRETHHGPIMARENDTQFLAVKIAKLFEGSRMVQAYEQTKARNFDEWYAAASRLNLQMFNTVYADRDGNIFYLYNGAIGRKDPSFDWERPVDGSDPRTEWNGLHPIEELPQVLNPISGYIQSCNATPFLATDDGNPALKDFPAYMAEDRFDDKRRSMISRYLLRNANGITFEDWQRLAYDTTMYWPMTELPRYARWFEDLKESDPNLAKTVEPYLNHLLDWDYKSTIESTQATLCVEWYEVLYGRGYPVETLKPEYMTDIPARFRALVQAADTLTNLFGTWKVPYGEIHRLQRHPNADGPASVPFSDDLPSIPHVGVRGPLGVAFTVYDTPSTPDRKKRYAVVGASFMGVYEFGDRVKAKTYLHYGQSGDPNSPHFFDQAELLSKQQFKDAWFYWDDVLANAKTVYHPGEEPRN
jgi:acyl-homoserine-lactone acylase